MTIIPLYAYGYATNIAFLDCACKWENRQVVVWIENSQDSKYVDLVTEAFNSWQDNFPKLQYVIHTDKPSKWGIHVKIVEKYLDVESLAVLAKSDIRAYWSDASIDSASIIIPTHTAKGQGEQVEFTLMNDTMFYNIILHEIGHAIGLGHANENEEGMIDPMFKYIDKNEEKRSVSKLDVMTLERLYRQ